MLQKTFFGPADFLPCSESAIKQKLMSNNLMSNTLPSGVAFCHDMNSLPAAVKANTIKLANNDVKLYNDWIRAPIKRNHRLKKPLKPIPPTAFPTVSEHIKQLTCFEMPMSNDRPMRSRHFFIRMRLRGIIDIEEELLNSIVQHLNDLQDLKDDNRTSGFTIAMMEGDLLRQLGVIRGRGGLS